MQKDQSWDGHKAKTCEKVPTESVTSRIQDNLKDDHQDVRRELIDSERLGKSYVVLRDNDHHESDCIEQNQTP